LRRLEQVVKFHFWVRTLLKWKCTVVVVSFLHLVSALWIMQSWSVMKMKVRSGMQCTLKSPQFQRPILCGPKFSGWIIMILLEKQSKCAYREQSLTPQLYPRTVSRLSVPACGVVKRCPSQIP